MDHCQSANLESSAVAKVKKKICQNGEIALHHVAQVDRFRQAALTIETFAGWVLSPLPRAALLNGRDGPIPDYLVLERDNG